MIKIKSMDTIDLLLAMTFFYGMVFVIFIIFEPIILVDSSITTLISIKKAFLWSIPVFFIIFFLKDCISIAPRSNSIAKRLSKGGFNKMFSKMKNHETSSAKADFQANEKELPLIPSVRNSNNAQHGIKRNFLKNLFDVTFGILSLICLGLVLFLLIKLTLLPIKC